MTDGCYYRDIVLMQQMLPSIRSTAGGAYVFRQDSAPARRVRQTVELLRRETPKCIVQTYGLQSPNSPDLNFADYRIMRCYAGLCLSDASSRRE